MLSRAAGTRPARIVSHAGEPVETAFIESFNGRLRDECLNQYWFLSLAEARRTIESWRLARSGWYRENILQLGRVLDNAHDECAILNAIDRLSWRDRVWLSMRANEFRRRKRDRVLLIMTIVAGLFR